MKIGQLFQTAEVKHTKFRMPLDGAEQVTATIGATISSIHVSALAPESAYLMEGELDYVGQLIAEDEGETRRQIVIRDDAKQTNYHGPELRFVIRVHPGVPLALKVGTASGDIHLDLLALALTSLDAGAASSAVWAALPAAQEAYPVHIGLASGDVHLTLAEQAEISALKIDTASGDIRLEAGAGAALHGAAIASTSGSTKLDLRHAASADVRLSAVSGDIHVMVHEQAPARVEVQNVLSGSVKMRVDLNRISGGKRTGVWQTDSYRPDAPAVAVVITNVISGDVRVS